MGQDSQVARVESAAQAIADSEGENGTPSDCGVAYGGAAVAVGDGVVLPAEATPASGELASLFFSAEVS